MRCTRTGLVFILLLGLILCSPKSLHAQNTPVPLPPGYHAEPYANGLHFPTHLTFGPDSAVYVTELNGGENDGTGRVVRIEKAGAEPSPVLTNLLKPTGLAFADNFLYIVVKDTLLVTKVNGAQFETPTPVFTQLPFNGRSNGQITLGPDGMLYFESTGSEAAPRDSGFIYSLKPDTTERKIYARGLKNAYAMTWNPKTGMMYATEIGDGLIPGIGQPPEELNIIKRGGNYGWPQCYADQKENSLWGGNRNICADTDVPLTTFPPQSTPTGLAWFDDQLIVALWNGAPSRLVSVDPKRGSVTDFGRVGRQPIALLTAPDGSLLVLDFLDGTIVRITKDKNA